MTSSSEDTKSKQVYLNTMGKVNAFPIKMSKNFTHSHMQRNTNAKEKIKIVFNDISLNLITFLENQKGITDVRFAANQSITEKQIECWEQKYFPCKLPADYIAFLRIANGFHLQWHMKYNHKSLPLGNMSLCPLSAMKTVDTNNFTFSKKEKNAEDNQNISSIDLPIAFNLDNTRNGIIAFLFIHGYENPSIWFKDLSCEWNFVCHTFTDYLRLMFIHLGLLEWKYAYTSIGLNQLTMQWMRFLIPNRLNIDLKHNENSYGWILPSKTKKKENVNGRKRKKKLNLNKIDHILLSRSKKNANNLNKNRKAFKNSNYSRNSTNARPCSASDAKKMN